ncbi:GNAT family N-acetyltransferase [halophilic archaeon]|nr:GNAT family N-acetyltransferase [halophilic archaeon]
MPGPVFVSGDTVSLRTLEREDLPFLQEHRNRPDVRRSLGRVHPQNREKLDQDFEGYMANAVNLLACVDGDPVGFVALFDWDESSGRAELAYWVSPDHQGNGYGTEVTELAVEYAFDERRCHRLVAGAHETNEASRALLETLGFREEGRQRQHVFVDGEYVDTVLYGLLVDEWRD